MSFKEKLKTLLQTKFVKKTCMVFSLIAITSALAFGTIACTPEQNVQDPPSPPITTPSDDLKPGDGTITPGDETTDPTDPDITDSETPTEPEDPGITEPEDPDITEPTDPENPDITDPETPVDPEEPEIEDPTPEISFEEVYNEVFGEGYDLEPFEQYFDKIPEMLFDISGGFKVLATEFNADNFVIYADCAGYADEELNNTFPGHRLARATYRGTTPAVLLDYEALTQETGGLPLKAYLESKYAGTNMSAEEIRTDLETYKTRTDAIDRMKRFFDAGCKTFFDLSTLITNTRDDIVIEDYIDVFLPEGAIAIKLYIDDLGASLPDQQKYFNSGYYQGCDSFMIYLDQEGNVVVDEYRLTFPSYTNDTPKTVYDRLLKEEGTYHRKTLQSTDILENPILSEELLANIENSL